MSDPCRRSNGSHRYKRNAPKALREVIQQTKDPQGEKPLISWHNPAILSSYGLLLLEFQMKQVLFALAFMMASPASAESVIGQYVAYIGRDDLYNSNGARLSEPWQVLRQDRANFHRFKVSQPGDEWDSFFSNIDNRAIMERMVMNGYIDPNARRNLVNGGAMVVVRIYGIGSTGRRVEVDVYN